MAAAAPLLCFAFDSAASLHIPMKLTPVPPRTRAPKRNHLQHPSRQRGVTLIELMVGIAIGLLVVAVAMGAVMVSRGVSGTVSDASGIQQQGSYVLRVIGQQLRQAGSLYLNPDPVGGGGTDVLTAVVFEIKADGHDGGNSFEQHLPEAIRALLEPEDTPPALRALLHDLVQLSPTFSLRGGTREILRGIIARELGLR